MLRTLEDELLWADFFLFLGFLKSSLRIGVCYCLGEGKTYYCLISEELLLGLSTSVKNYLKSGVFLCFFVVFSEKTSD